MTHTRSTLYRVTTFIVLTAMILTSLPAEELIAAIREQQQKGPAKIPPPSPVKVNRTPAKVAPFSTSPVFSANPKDEEIQRARVFEEPLVPMGGATTVEENRALVAALLAYRKQSNSEDLGVFEDFLLEHPQSPWRVSLWVNMGLVYRRTGYITRALDVWSKAWTLGKNETAPIPKAVADQAVAEWASLNGSLGRYEVLEPLFQEIAGRDIGGSAAEKLRGARQGLWLMYNKPEDAFRCGPMALDRILAFTNATYDKTKITSSRSTMRGMSLPQVLALGRDLGMDLQMAYREVGAEILLPAVVHWKAGHYAALVKEENGRYLVQDPTFGSDFWVSRTALNEQASGYFLVAAGKLPNSWRPVSDPEGKEVWGKGQTNTDENRDITPQDKKVGGQEPCEGMAFYSMHAMLGNLNITDIPLSYTPPRGPVVAFVATYNHREVFQPAAFTYSNLGPQWTFNWLSYVKDEPTNLSADALLYVRGGGERVYSGFTNGVSNSTPEHRSRAVLARTSVYPDPIRYERRLPDGSLEVFAQSDGGTSSRRVFMTEWHDTLGNKLTFKYDASLRLYEVLDAIGQVTTLSYQLASDPLKITKVTDPFQRFATFEYNAAGRLSRITDTIGIQSQFTYSKSLRDGSPAPGDFISHLTTPYGTTVFEFVEESYLPGTDRIHWLQATDPMGGTERLEFRHNATGIPNSTSPVPVGIVHNNTLLQFRNTFYWDKNAWKQHPRDYTKATIYHWLHGSNPNVNIGILESMKPALESRIYFDYPRVMQPPIEGWEFPTRAEPKAVARVLDDGTTQLYKYEHNVAGKVTKVVDPLLREMVFIHGTGSTQDPDQATGTGIDLLEVRQKASTSDLLEKITYNTKHQPLTITDAALQTTTFTYFPTGELEKVITPPRAGLSEAQRTTTYTYYPDNAQFGPGRLQRITGPVAGATTDFSYDGYGRLRTVTESDSYAVTTDYDTFDRPTQITFPDGTFEQRLYNRLDLSDSRDRLGRWTHFFYDAMRRPVLTRDPLGQTITQQWCNCGSLEKLIDANGNATTWERDAQSRITKETRADNTSTQYVYENRTSRLWKRIDANGQTRQVTYDEDDNVNQITYINAQQPTPNVSFFYDPLYNRIATMVDGTGTTVYSYHPVTESPGTLGATQLKEVNGPLNNDLITYGYDELGRTLSRSINSVTASQTYEPLGRINSVTNVLGNFTYAYVGQTSRMQSISYPNGQSTSFAYLPNTGDRRLQEIHNQKTGPATISKFNYTYDVVGNIKTWTQQADGNPAKAFDFTYDRTDQMTGAVWRTTDPTPTILKRYGYSYDSAGNRMTEQLDDTPFKTSYNNMNRITTQDPGGSIRFAGSLNEPARVTVANKPAVVNADNTFAGTTIVTSGTNTVDVKATDYANNTRTNTYSVNITPASTKNFTYDANGNMTSDSTRTFEWDAENRLLAVNNGTLRSEFTYDGLSRRIRIIEKNNAVETSNTRFLWCGEEICEERDSTGASTTKRFFAQGEQQGADTFFYKRDHLGSIRELVETTTAATVRARYEYDPYGRVTKVSGVKDASFTFTGHYPHAPSGLLLTYFRAYDPILGRWLSEDPSGLADGLGLFTYVHGNPTGYMDPSGEGAIAAGFGVIGGALGFVGTGGLAVASGGILAPTIVAGTAAGIALGVATGLALENAIEATRSALQPPLQMGRKGKSGRQRDSGLEDVSDEEVTRRSKDPTRTPAERQRYTKEDKARRNRNIEKRRPGLVVPLVPCEEKDESQGKL